MDGTIALVDGGHLAFEDVGEGPAVVFLHPGLWDMRTWDPQIPTFADAGYRVVVTYSPSNTKYRAWLEEMKGRGHSFAAFPVDVVDYDDCAKKCAQIQAECGQIDILVNNAGITRDMTFKKMTKSDWDAVMRTNLDSCFNMTKQVMDGMVDRGWGRVINVSSVNGQKGAFGQTNYSAAKAGIHGFTKALAQEGAAKGITVNAVCPGFTDTPMLGESIRRIADTTKRNEADVRADLAKRNAQARFIQPKEVADVVLWLCSDAAAAVTGQAIAVSGGETW